MITETSRTDSTVNLDVTAWWRLWAMAVFAHVISNAGAVDGRLLSGLINAALGLTAIAVIVQPDDRRLRTALMVLLPISVFGEAPFLGNHWLVAGAVALAALIARPWDADAEFWRRFAPLARLVLIVFYSFAAFAKLNAGFFDPVASCARYFANRTLDFWFLPEVAGDSPIATVLPYIATAIELSVPVLLIVPRTRRAGVWLGLAFHLALTLDLRQHFFDFTMVLVPLFLLFAAPGTLARLDSRWPRLRLGGGRPWMAIAAVGVLAITLPAPVTAKGMTIVFSWAVWLYFLVVLVRAVVVSPPQADRQARVGPVNALGFVLLVALLANGVSPYLELKSATGFNMYANLETLGGETNHFLVPATLQLRNDQTDLVTIIDSDDEDLLEYIDEGFALPAANLRHYLAAHPDTTITFDYEGARYELERAGDHPEWLDAQPILMEKFGLFRAVSSDAVPACQPSWLAAR